MRAALWFVGLFGLAVAVALFAGNNQGIVTLFWPPYRVDLSLNMVLLVLAVGFAVLYAALRAFSVLIMLPHHAKRWRQQQKERSMYQAMVESLSHSQAGRYVRARKSASTLLKLSDELRAEHAGIPQDASLRAIAHMLTADSAHALRDTSARDHHYQQALEDVPLSGSLQQQEVREGAQMRAARWALDDRDPHEALQRLEQLPPGAARRTMALRIQLKATRLANQTQAALDTARLLAKHGGLPTESASSITRGLLAEQIRHTHDPDQLQQLWSALPEADRSNIHTALTAAQKMLDLHGDPAVAREWLRPVWEQYLQAPQKLSSAQSLRLVHTLQQALEDLDSAWLRRIEAAHHAAPQEARLQYLAGMACMQRQLWGKAEQLLQHAVTRLSDAPLRASAWKALAILAEQREDSTAAAQAWRQAALQNS
ncbi:MAG: heme biosynthesis protein HemY [Comamonas sp.]|nr:heme biosynthesis protein HemY [Candidatus Comamonas equi]